MNRLEEKVELHESLSHDLQSLVELARRKRDLILKGDHRGIAQLVQEEAGLITRVQRAKKAIIGDVDSEPQTGSLEKVFALVKEMKSLNELNSQLIRHTLSYIDFAVNLFAGLGEQVTYSRPGGTTGSQVAGRSIIDQKA